MVDPEVIRKNYASLSDEQLLEIDRSELVEVAKKLYDQELARRELHSGKPLIGGTHSFYAERNNREGLDETIAPDWLEDAIAATAFTDSGSSASENAAYACDALRAAGIPCEIVQTDEESETTSGSPNPELRVMVPGALILLATSILDKEIFNPKMEEDWKAHFANITDDQLLALDADTICSGLLDRAERLRKALDAEVKNRGLKPYRKP